MLQNQNTMNVIISEYYYYSSSIYNSSWKFIHKSVFIFNKLIYNKEIFYNSFPSAIYSFYQQEMDKNNIRVYYLCG